MEVDGRSNFDAEVLRANRVKVENALTRWTSFQEMEAVVKQYLVDLFGNLRFLKDEKDIRADLEILKKLSPKLDSELMECEIASMETELSYLHTAEEIIMMHGIEEMLNSDPEISNDNWILEMLMNPNKTELRKWLKFLRKRLRILEELLGYTKGRGSELKDQQQMEGQPEDQKGREANQLEDQTEMKVNKLDKEVMKARLMSLNIRLASAKSEMDRICDRIGDFPNLHHDLKHTIGFFEYQLRLFSQKLSEDKEEPELEDEETEEDKEEPELEDKETEPEDHTFA